MSETVTVNSRMKYPEILEKIGHLGELRVAKIYVKNDVMTVEFRQRTFGEWVKETFSKNDTLALTARVEVLKALEPLMQKSKYSDQLLQNARDRVAHNVGISGRSLRRDYRPVQKKKKPMPLRGGTVAAISKGNSIQLVEADPAKIKCAHAVLRTSTAIAEATRHPNCSQLKQKLEKFQQDKPSGTHTRDQPVPVGIIKDPIPVNLAATSWTCITDLKLPELQGNKATISPETLAELLKASVKNQQGAVVIEVIRDRYEERFSDELQKPVGKYSCTPEGLLTQLETARALVEEAKKSKRDLVITFASKDNSVLTQMKLIDQQIP